MADDARIRTDLPNHPKTRKLEKRLGDAGPWCLVKLFLWAASSRPDGDLEGFSGEDIELAVRWAGDDGAFVTALLEIGFLECHDSSYRIHDWEDWNPWLASKPARVAAARKANQVRWNRFASDSDTARMHSGEKRNPRISSLLTVSDESPLPPDDTFRGDEGFEEITAIYAKREKGHAAAVAYQNAIREICKDQNIQPADAHKWLMERTRLYVQRTEPRFQKGLTDYLTKHVYAQDESAWGAKGGMNGHSPPLQNPAEETRKRRGVMPSA